MNTTIPGAGNGEQSIAVDLALSGQSVRLAALDTHARGIPITRITGRIYLEGASSLSKTGCAKIDLATTVEMGSVVYAEPGWGLGRVSIRSLNEDMLCAAYTARKTDTTLERIRGLHPTMQAGKIYLKSTLWTVPPYSIPSSCC